MRFERLMVGGRWEESLTEAAMRWCRVNLSSHGASGREAETQQQKQAQHRRWFIVTGLSQLGRPVAAGCQESSGMQGEVAATPDPVFMFLFFFLICFVSADQFIG